MSEMGAIATIRFEAGKTVATRQVLSLEDVDALLAEHDLERAEPIIDHGPAGFWCVSSDGVRVQLLLTPVADPLGLRTPPFPPSPPNQY